MITKIGINVLTTTAKQQEKLTYVKYSGAYYDNYYQTLYKSCQKIILKYTESYFEIQTYTFFHKNGDVSNSIIFCIQNQKGFNKKELRKELNKHIKSRLRSIFK